MGIDYNKLKNTYQSKMDEMIENMGKNCRLLFPAKLTNVNSNFNDPTRNRGTLRPDYSATSDDQKPVKTVPNENIKALVEWNPRKSTLIENIKIVEGENYIKIKTYIRYADEIERCEFLIPNYDSERIHQTKYRLVRSINPRGLVEDKYISSYWQEVNA